MQRMQHMPPQQRDWHKMLITQVIQLSIMQRVMHLLQFNHRNWLIVLRSQPLR